jgi:tetratricopeptide (TPR) repeat protein
MVAEGYDPFRGSTGGGRWVPAKPVQTAPPNTIAAQELQLRREISQAFADRDIAAAAGKYLELLRVAPDAVLSRQQQLDVANQLMSTDQHAGAALAYEVFLKHYADYEYAADIYLMLGILYNRYLHQDQEALKYLQRAVETLRDQRKLDLARSDLQAVQQRLAE